MRAFTREELRRYGGLNGAPVYFAYGGKVYDASASWHWRGGKHQVAHEAGSDLTEALAGGPHGEEWVLQRLPVIGVLCD